MPVLTRTRVFIWSPSTPWFAVVATASRTGSELLPVVSDRLGDLGERRIVGALPVGKEVDVFAGHGSRLEVGSFGASSNSQDENRPSPAYCVLRIAYFVRYSFDK